MTQELIRILIVEITRSRAKDRVRDQSSDRQIDMIVANEASTRGGALNLLDENFCGGARGRV
jgi:hypothetical protein